MSSLVERLRVRSEQRPSYNLDDSDEDDLRGKSGLPPEKSERYVRDDAKDGLCQACGEEGDLLSCETCTYAYHSKCLLPPLKAQPPENWKCPECVSPLNDIEKILDCEKRPTVASESDASTLSSNQLFVKQYLVKWKGLSYLHCTWVPEKEFIKAFRSLPRLKTKVNNFHRQMETVNSLDEEFIAIRPEWVTVDRIIACRGTDEQKEYLVKWKELGYDECHWESESDLSAFRPEIERFHKFNSRPRRSSARKEKSQNLETAEPSKKQKEFQPYERSPEFISGGSLHPYQLEGLNFLRYSWFKETHVILADEMGLGKTIQSITFLASLFEDNVSPFLVIAPLSTLRNWEREFAKWAPQMNVVMYVGTAQARAVIKEREFYFSKKRKSKKKKKSGQGSESKQARIKFHVLLTSYEMINNDSTTLRPIKWECLIVDEGHRLKNKESKLFLSLAQYMSRHRVLLTGTPLQNNLQELFMLMNFLDPEKFGNLDDIRQEDINQEEKISKLHHMLAPHLLRRVKKDVMTELPPKKELILRVELSSKQKEYYKAILTRNYQILTRKGGAQVSLNNVVMELRKLCCHPYMLEGVEPDIDNSAESFKQLLETSGKLHLLDKMMVKLKDQGHRVLIYTQFQRMLDLLEDYCAYKKWTYERIDGKVSGAERQIRIDRFNAKDSSKFCFLLSTRAGGLGINLATADTVIIYDSDWNPHADLQAMARAHRLGQSNKVMIYRLITRGTIEERMMQLTKKKMVLEHLVVGHLQKQGMNQEELDDIIRYGSKELFADENDEAGKSRQIHYDESAIDRLLDRDQIDEEDATVDEEEDNSFLKNFKVANFEYIDGSETVAEVEVPEAMENEGAVNDSERNNYWEELLRDQYEVQKVEEFTAMGKGKRSRKQMVSVDDDDLAGLEDVSSDGEDDNYEADLTDGDALNGMVSGRRPYRKRSRIDSSEPLPLMEGEGKSLRILGFNKHQRYIFVQTLMRFGTGEYDWAEFVPRLKQKTFEEIHEYGRLFLTHIVEDETDSPNFSDGVPKEDLRVQDVLLRLAVLMLIRDKVKFINSNPGDPLFGDDIVSVYPALKGGRFWKEEHDKELLRAVMKHGYGRWQYILDDQELMINKVVSRELNLPLIRVSVGTVEAQDNGNSSAAETNGNQSFKIDGTNGVNDAVRQAQLYQDASSSYNEKEIQRRYVEFVKKRVLLLEKAFNVELYKEHLAAGDASNVNLQEDIDSEIKMQVPGAKNDARTLVGQLPRMEYIGPEVLSSIPSDDKTARVKLATLYNQMCGVLEDKGTEFVESYTEVKPISQDTLKSFSQLESIAEDIKSILTPAAPDPKLDKEAPSPDDSPKP
uniref:CHD3-type chromatin-remodeling factor PICKLE n=1 Tax=Kalanchoe fedtschenkoi TaxID=63787 RepID=A0A7N0U7Q7_KALFE